MSPSSRQLRPQRSITPLSYVSFYLVVLFSVRADFIIAGAGQGGSPLVVLGLIALAWWLISRFVLGIESLSGWNPVRLVLLCYFAFVILSWVNGKHKLLASDASSQADSRLMVITAMVGIALVTMDGLTSRAEVERLIKVTIAASMVMVAVGVLQFTTHVDPTGWLSLLPGFELGPTDLESRSIFTRPQGTSLHPIEFGVVCAGLVPLAYYVQAVTRQRRWTVAIAALFFGSMIALSRSAVLALSIGLILLIVNASSYERVRIISIGLMMLVCAGLLVDGLLGSVRNLFADASTDSSVQARLDRTPRVMELIAENPWFGRGFGTYVNADDFVLDNEIQKAAIENGLIGVAVLVLTIGIVVAIAWRLRSRGGPDTRHAGTALSATILALFVSSYTFDAFFYRILTSLLYISIGLVGALWRLSAVESSARLTPVIDHRAAPVRT